MKDSLVFLVKNLLVKNKIAHDYSELAFQIKSHPSYPSLHSITGVLDHFNIENVAASVPQSLEIFRQLPEWFIAQIETEGSNQLVLVRRKEHCTIFPSANKSQKMSEESFLEKFTGIVVVVEKKEKDEAYSNHNERRKNVALCVFVFLSIIMLWKIDFTILSSLYLLLSALGSVVSLSILKQELGINNTIGNAFCATSAHEKKDCDAVLFSKGALIFNKHKLSDLGLLYFVGVTVCSLFLLVHGNIAVLYGISLLSLPITVYSIYYQYAVVKKWCALCLSIAGVLWLQAGVALSFFYFALYSLLTVEDIVIVAFSFMSIFIVWSYLKPLYIELVDARKEKVKFYKFKRNYELFSTLLNQPETVDIEIPATKEIVLGGQSTNLQITLITNPLCGHCRPTHKTIEEILKRFDEQVKILIRFNVNTSAPDREDVKVSSKLLEIYSVLGAKICLSAMGQIYRGELASNWLKKWGVCLEKETYLNVLQVQSQWCKTNGINFTPEILVNGKSYPKEYERADLIYFIEELLEDCIKSNGVNDDQQTELISIN